MPGNVSQRLEAAARRNPDKQVIFCGDEALDWRTLDRRSNAVARALRDRGAGPGRRLALALADPLHMVIGVIAGLKSGAAIAPLNPRLSDDERGRIIEDLASPLMVDTLPDGTGDFVCETVDAADAAIILYTSGSTGRPKGVVLSHGAVAAGLDIWINDVMALVPDDVMLSALPLAHSFGLFGTMLSPLQVGASTVLLPRFTPEDALAAIGRWRPTVFPGVATMFRRVLDCPQRAATDFSSLRIAVSGAAPCPWALAEEWRHKTGLRIVRGYGMSELFRPISFSARDATEEPDSIGRALTGVTLRIVDDDGEALGHGEVGELWIRSPACLTEYLGQPEETRAVLEDGWFKTGDLATLSADGLVRIVGRKKEIILRGGYTVAAGEVESVLMTHPEVVEVAVIGVPHDDLGEEIRAYVMLKAGATTEADDIIAWARQHLANYKYPREVRLCAELPHTATGKVDKTHLPA